MTFKFTTITVESPFVSLEWHEGWVVSFPILRVELISWCSLVLCHWNSQYKAWCLVSEGRYWQVVREQRIKQSFWLVIKATLIYQWPSHKLIHRKVAIQLIAPLKLLAFCCSTRNIIRLSFFTVVPEIIRLICNMFQSEDPLRLSSVKPSILYTISIARSLNLVA